MTQIMTETEAGYAKMVLEARLNAERAGGGRPDMIDRYEFFREISREILRSRMSGKPPRLLVLPCYDIDEE